MGQPDWAALGGGYFDFDVRGGFDEDGDGGVIEIAFAAGDQRGDHLLHLRSERKADAVGLGGLEGVTQVLLVKVEFEAGPEVARDEHGTLGVEHSAAGKASLDGVNDNLGIEAAARGKRERLAHGGYVAGDHDLIGELGGVACTDRSGERNGGPHALEDGLGLGEDLGLAANHDGERAVDGFGFAT